MTDREMAGAAFAAWDELGAALVATTPPEIVQLARQTVSGALGTEPGPAERSAAVHFGEQVVIDVASVPADLRAAALAELGSSSAGFVLALWVEDMTVRADRAFRNLCGQELMRAQPATSEADVWVAQERFLTEVAKLSAVDPVTTELVRLRGARAHACRLCQSRRNVTAIEAAGTTDIFESEEPSGLTDAQELDLCVVDTFVWQPLQWPSDLGARVAAALGPAATVELVLDVVRNAANKIAVAFAADAPQVASGVEYFDIDPDTGGLRYDFGTAGA